MKKILGLDDWKFTTTPVENNLFSIRISFQYPDVSLFRHLSPPDRKKFIACDQKDKYAELIASGLIGEHTISGSKQKPRGVETTVDYKTLKKLARMKLVSHIFINNIEGAKKMKQREEAAYYCVKMTVAIEIEGLTSGLQTYEERYVLIKAKSHEDAYRKIEKTKDKYCNEYINPYGYLARWRIESLDDCYATDITGIKDLNNREGAEVYSVLKKRKMTKDRVWMGYLDK